ncbi:FAD/NAD(P)-binding protein [Dongia sp. agr-C8]
MARAIGVIGGGFTGALLALHLLRRCDEQDSIFLIEKARRFGAGLAYSTGNAHHLLNVRAGNMSAFSAEPDHFVDWLRRLPDQGGVPPGPASFAPRGLFGAYIQQSLAEAIWRGQRGDRLTIVNDEAVGIEREVGGIALKLAVGRKLVVDTAVLAVGNFPPARSAGPVFGNPWDERALRDLDPQAPLLVLGTGLTMVDTVISLLDQGHMGSIQAISRRGLLPRQHVGAIPDETGEIRLPKPWDFDPKPSGRSLVALTQAVRRTIDRAERAGRGWRSVIDGLRPHSQRLWREMSLVERKRFLRHLRPWWDVHRHRGAPQVMARIAEARERGQLKIVAGKVVATEAGADTVSVEVKLRGGDTRAVYRGARLIDCSGLNSDCTTVDQPLLKQLLQAGLIRPDPLRLGIDVTDEGALIDGDGRPAADLFALGPITKGAFWEIIAVPDLRVACEAMAARLLPQAARPQRYGAL